MSILTLRLPETLDQALVRASRQAGVSKSVLARQALVAHLSRLERRLHLQGMAAELQQAYGDPARLREARDLGEEPFDGLDAQIEAERRAGLNPEEPWWR